MDFTDFLVTRNENGDLIVDRLELNILFDEMFEECKNEKEMKKVGKSIISALESACCDMRDDNIAPNFSIDSLIEEYFY